MGNQILTRFSKQRLSLSNSYVARSLTIGASWTRLRVGVWCGVYGAATISGTPRFTLGLCASAGAIYPNSTHFAGMQSDSASWTAAANYFTVGGTSSTGRWRLLSKVGTTETPGPTNNLAINAYIAGGTTPSSSNSLTGFDIEKTSGTTFTLRMFGQTSTTQSALDYTAVLSAMEGVYNSFTLVNHGYLKAAETLTVDEGANGALTVFNLAWDRTDPVVDLLGAFVVKLN